MGAGLKMADPFIEHPEFATSETNAKAKAILKTAPFDPRFPNMNQTRNCWQNYVDFYRCQNLKGEDYEPCIFFKKNFKILCPNSWIERWDDKREAGTFPTKLD